MIILIPIVIVKGSQNRTIILESALCLLLIYNDSAIDYLFAGCFAGQSSPQSDTYESISCFSIDKDRRLEKNRIARFLTLLLIDLFTANEGRSNQETTSSKTNSGCAKFLLTRKLLI